MKCPNCQHEFSLGDIDTRKEGAPDNERCQYYLWPMTIVGVMEQCIFQEGHNYRHNTEAGKDGGWRKIGSHTL